MLHDVVHVQVTHDAHLPEACPRDIDCIVINQNQVNLPKPVGPCHRSRVAGNGSRNGNGNGPVFLKKRFNAHQVGEKVLGPNHVEPSIPFTFSRISVYPSLESRPGCVS